jgi:sugar phosphate isomerase/epimerase
MPEVYLHSWNYRDDTFATAVARGAAFGYDGIEVYGGHFPDAADPVGGLEELCRVAGEGGLPVKVAPLIVDVLTVADGEVAARTGAAVDLVTAAGRLGIPTLNAMIGWLRPDAADRDGSALATDAHFERAIKLCGELAEAAEAAGVQITLETHMQTIHDVAASTRRIIEAVDSPQLRVNFDAGNMYSVAHAEPADEALDQLREQVTYVHLKNCRDINGQFDYHWSLAGGDLDYRRLVGSLAGGGFAGPYCIEYSGAGDRDQATRADLAYLRGLFADLGIG